MVINQSTFQEVSSNVGIVWSRQRGDEAFSVNWTDLNNDGLIDLWINGHGFNAPSLAFPDGKVPYRYINTGNGTFQLDRSDFRRGSGGDVHASTIIDADNDGDKDVFTSVGGNLGSGSIDEENFNKFFINNSGNLQDQAASRGLEYGISRGRSSLWFDGNGDGLLDVLLVVASRDDGQAQTAFFQQRSNGTFFDASAEVGLDVNNEPSRYAQLGDLNGDGNVDLLIHGTYNFPLKVYDFASNGTWRDITGNFSNLQATLEDAPSDTTRDFVDTTAPRDSTIGDFNGDGFNDIFVVRSRTDVSTSSIFQSSDSIVSADLFLRGEAEIGFSFQTLGDIAVDVFNFVGTAGNLDSSEVFIGKSGRNPSIAELAAFTNTEEALKETANVVNTDVPNFVLSPDDSSTVGIAENKNQKGLYIGYDPGSQTWDISLSSPEFENIQVTVDSTQNVANLNSSGFTTPDDFASLYGVPDVLWIYNPNTGRYENRSAAAGVDRNTMSQSVVSGDFDNDGDLDLYLANANPSFNEPNVLYDNQGNGTFTVVSQAGGAAGATVGPHRLDFEVGQRIAVADYDNNGFLDIFAGSTTDRSSAGTTYLGTPAQLFRNRGNGNNWYILNLQGVESNRDGIGARVFLTTPDGQTQLREQNSGIHHYAQNSQRVHFGLGSNSSISSLVIEWPSGIRQELTDISDINRVVNITEEGEVGNPGGPDPSEGDDLIDGTETGNLLFGGDGNDTLNGLAGPDTLNGDNGNDSLDGGNNNDLLNGGNDDDLLNGGEGADTLLGEAGNDLLEGLAGKDLIDGGAGDDTLSGNNGDDTLIGASGTDLVVESGNVDFTLTDDRLFGRDTDELVAIEQASIAGGGSANTLDASGSSLNVTLFGAGGGDIITGGSNNDVLVGGSGADTLAGGAGDDRFTYERISDRNDRIVDFQPGNDSLVFAASEFGSDLTADDILGEDRFAVGTSANEISDRFIYNDNNGDLFYDADGSESQEQILIAKLENVPTLSNADIFIEA